MKTIIKVLLASSLLLPFATQAAPDECSAWLATEFDSNGTVIYGEVAMAIDEGVYTRKRASTDESNLLAKLAAAEGKVWHNKFSNAIATLEQMTDKATSLVESPKPKLEDANDINYALASAMDCVGNLEGEKVKKTF